MEKNMDNVMNNGHIWDFTYGMWEPEYLPISAEVYLIDPIQQLYSTTVLVHPFNHRPAQKPTSHALCANYYLDPPGYSTAVLPIINNRRGGTFIVMVGGRGCKKGNVAQCFHTTYVRPHDPGMSYLGVQACYLANKNCTYHPKIHLTAMT